MSRYRDTTSSTVKLMPATIDVGAARGRTPGTASPRRGCPARRPRTRTGSRDPPGEKSRGLLEDLDLLLEPLDLALEPLRLRLLGLALAQRPRRARRQVLVAPPAQLAGAEAE